MPRLRQNGRRSSSSCMFVRKCVPNQTGGGEAKMSARACVAKTKVNQNGAASRITPAKTSASVATRAGAGNTRAVRRAAPRRPAVPLGAGAPYSGREGSSPSDIARSFLAEQLRVAVGQRGDDEEQQPRHGRRGAEVAVGERHAV